MPTGHISGPYVQPPSVPEASSPRGGLFRSAALQKSPLTLGFNFYVKIKYAEQLFTSKQRCFINIKIMEWYFGLIQ